VHGAAYFADLVAEVRKLRAGDLLLFTGWRGDADERLHQRILPRHCRRYRPSPERQPSGARPDPDDLHAISRPPDPRDARKYSALGALTEDGGAQRPLNYCDSCRLPDMLLVACWPGLRAVGF
jgi:hypothetical protein